MDNLPGMTILFLLQKREILKQGVIQKRIQNEETTELPPQRL